MINLLNPKLTLFFVAFLPRFVQPTDADPRLTLAMMGLVLAVQTFLVFLLYGAMVAQLAALLREQPRIVTAVNVGVAALFARLGLRVILGPPRLAVQLAPATARDSVSSAARSAGRAQLSAAMALASCPVGRISPTTCAPEGPATGSSGSAKEHRTMRRSRFPEDQTLGIVKEHGAGRSAAELCRKQGISDVTLCARTATHGGRMPSEASRLKKPEVQGGRV